jgi:hypothetical protein
MCACRAALIGGPVGELDPQHLSVRAAAEKFEDSTKDEADDH